jgi:hypothetical protein
MKVVKPLLSLVVLLTLHPAIYAQGDARWELIAAGGVASYSGDLGGDQTKFLSDHPKKLGYAFGLGSRFIISNRFSIQFGINQAKVSGADSLSNNIDKKLRNLSFRSSITEGYLKGEVSIVNWEHVNGRENLSDNSNLYLFAGISFFRFNPEAFYNNTWHRLQPLGTEGQGIASGKGKYSLTASAFIVGAGYRHRLGDVVSLGFEIGARKTSTDYLDDVSTVHFDNAVIQATYGDVAAALADRYVSDPPRPAGTPRGSPKQKDYFMVGQVTLAFKLGAGGSGYGYGGGGRFRTRSKCFSF